LVSLSFWKDPQMNKLKCTRFLGHAKDPKLSARFYGRKRRTFKESRVANFEDRQHGFIN
jgi:hypothetical protein